MSDLIDRQAAIDALDEQIRQCDKALSAFDISMKDAYAVKVERASLVAFRETLEYMPSAQPDLQPTCNQLAKDCISRQDAIDVLEKDKANLDHIIKKFSGYDVRIDNFVAQRNQLDCDIDAIRNLPSAPLYTPDELQTMQDLEWSQMEKMYELGREESKWISCKERLPEGCTDVLCCDAYGEQLIGMPYVDNDSNTGYSAESGVMYMADCIAWQPLPEPWKGEKESERSV